MTLSKGPVMTASHPQPAPRHIPLRHEDSATLAPPILIKGLFGLALAVLVAVAAARLSGVEPSATPHQAEITASRTVTLVGGGAQAVTVLDETGAVLVDLAHGGFVTVIQNGLQRARLVAGVDQDLPIRLVAYANGRLTAEDPHSGYSVELGSFGADNRAAFERLMTAQRATP